MKHSKHSTKKNVEYLITSANRDIILVSIRMLVNLFRRVIVYWQAYFYVVAFLDQAFPTQ